MRLVAHVGIAFGGRVQLLLEHAFVNGADRELGSAKDAGSGVSGVLECILGHSPANSARNLLRAIGGLFQCVLLTFAPLLGPIGVIDRHAHDTDG